MLICMYHNPNELERLVLSAENDDDVKFLKKVLKDLEKNKTMEVKVAEGSGKER